MSCFSGFFYLLFLYLSLTLDCLEFTQGHTGLFQRFGLSEEGQRIIIVFLLEIVLKMVLRSVLVELAGDP